MERDSGSLVFGRTISAASSSPNTENAQYPLFTMTGAFHRLPDYPPRDLVNLWTLLNKTDRSHPLHMSPRSTTEMQHGGQGQTLEWVVRILQSPVHHLHQYWISTR